MKEVNNFHLYHWVGKQYYYSLNLHETQTPCSPFFLVVVLFLAAPMRSSSELWLFLLSYRRILWESAVCLPLCNSSPRNCHLLLHESLLKDLKIPKDVASMKLFSEIAAESFFGLYTSLTIIIIIILFCYTQINRNWRTFMILHTFRHFKFWLKIGRASCRERV